MLSFLDELRDVIWGSYGNDIIQMMQDASSHDAPSDESDEIELNDDIPFRRRLSLSASEWRGPPAPHSINHKQLQIAALLHRQQHCLKRCWADEAVGKWIESFLL